MWWLLKHLVKHNQFVSRLLKTAVLSATHILTQIHSHTNKQTRAYCLQLKTWQDAKLDTDLFQKAKCCVVLSKAAETVKGTVHPIIKIVIFLPPWLYKNVAFFWGTNRNSLIVIISSSSELLKWSWTGSIWIVNKSLDWICELNKLILQKDPSNIL